MTELRTVSTITVQIGNSDDKLTHVAWSRFVHDVGQLVRFRANHIHFAGTSEGSQPWQNYCWVFEIHNRQSIYDLRASLRTLADNYCQESIAWTEGVTELLGN